jgi:hypothetical protein
MLLSWSQFPCLKKPEDCALSKHRSAPLDSNQVHIFRTYMPTHRLPQCGAVLAALCLQSSLGPQELWEYLPKGWLGPEFLRTRCQPSQQQLETSEVCCNKQMFAFCHLLSTNLSEPGQLSEQQSYSMSPHHRCLGHGNCRNDHEIQDTGHKITSMET